MHVGGVCFLGVSGIAAFRLILGGTDHFVFFLCCFLFCWDTYHGLMEKVMLAEPTRIRGVAGWNGIVHLNTHIFEHATKQL